MPEVLGRIVGTWDGKEPLLFVARLPSKLYIFPRFLLTRMSGHHSAQSE